MTTRLMVGDALEQLATLPDRSVHMCVTSPPYYGLRDYGDPRQIGLEKTPEEYLDRLVLVFDAVWQKLRDDGTLWINIGDSYVGAGGRGGKEKDLMLIPAQLSLRLRAAGWYVRNDIIWAKPNPMPESVRDRCTRSHEHLFLLTKKPTYYYDDVAIREQAKDLTRADMASPAYFGGKDKSQGHSNRIHSGRPYLGTSDGQRNKRDVWTIATVPLKEAHFAAFPPELVENCIMAGSSSRACPICGAPWERQTEERSIDRTELPPEHPEYRPRQYVGKIANSLQPAMGAAVRGKYRSIATTGWAEGCDCEYETPSRCVVLDPFAGSGTTGMVAERLGRDAILIDLSYNEMQERRITNDNPLFNQITRGTE